MARSPVAFQDAFDAVCGRLGYTRAQIDAAGKEQIKADILREFNLAYQVGYDVPGPQGWEDARVGAEIEPEDGTFIDFATVGDGREFDIWNGSPRGTDAAYRLESPRDWTTDYDGITLRASFDTVWMSWIPETVEFTTEAWETSTPYVAGDTVLFTNGNNYRCLVAHTSGTFATDLANAKWVLVPVLGVMKAFIIAHTQGGHLIKNGNPETGFAMQRAALDALEQKALAEVQRNNREPWRGTYCLAYPTAGTSVTARYLEWPSGITGLTGGGGTNLDGLTTTRYTTGKLICFAISGQFQVWELQAVSTAEDSTNGIVRPDDYDGTSNQRTWIRIS